MGIKDDIGDSAFKAGMLAGAQALGDGITSSSGQFDSKWNAPFKQDIHGVILITGHDDATTAAKLQQVQKIFSIGTPTAMIREVGTSVGRVRDKDPKGQDVKGHEQSVSHGFRRVGTPLISFCSFGFLDGISEPAVQGVDLKTNRGQETIRQGIVLLGREGDSVSRPSWALDGSFLSFRYLCQLVPEFDAFLTANAIKSPNMSQEQGSELLGARLVGRWKSGM